MTNREKFLKLVSEDKNNTIQRAKERIFKRNKKNIMSELYKGYSIEPADTIYSPEFQIIIIDDCDDFVRYANTLDEAKLIIDEILEDERI